MDTDSPLTTEKVTRYGFRLKPSDGSHVFEQMEKGEYVTWAAYERLLEILTIPNITPDTTSSAMFLRTLREHEKCQPVNVQDLINALMWRVGNQRREIARLHEELKESESEKRDVAAEASWKERQGDEYGSY